MSMLRGQVRKQLHCDLTTSDILFSTSLDRYLVCQGVFHALACLDFERAESPIYRLLWLTDQNLIIDPSLKKSPHDAL